MSYDVIDLGTIAEKTTVYLGGNPEAVLRDQTGAAIPAASLSAFTATLYDVHTADVVNSRNAQSILNVNGGTVDSGGVWSFRLDVADTAILNANRTAEVRRLMLEWGWQGGTRFGRQEYEFTITNLLKAA